MAGRKSSRSTVDARRADVERAMARGEFTRRHRRELAARWGVSDRQILRDRDAVVQDWEDGRRGVPRERERVRILEQSQEVFREALNLGDARALQVAHQCLDFQAEVLGVKAPVQVDVNVAANPAGVALEVVSLLDDVAALVGVPVAALPDLHAQTKDQP